MKPKILFLGPEDSPLLVWLKENGEAVTATTNKISPDYIKTNRFDFLVSYGYRHILKKPILDLFPQRAINLHISYLPYNRGADPNFWSFIESTPKGVTIHYIDEGVDTGDIIVQKKVDFSSSVHEATLASTYETLHHEIQQLFFQNWASIKSLQCQAIPQSGTGTLHRLKDKTPYLHLLEEAGWNTKVSSLTNYLKQ